MDPFQDEFYMFDDSSDSRQGGIPFWFWWLLPSPWSPGPWLPGPPPPPPGPWHPGPWLPGPPPRPPGHGGRPPRW